MQRQGGAIEGENAAYAAAAEILTYVRMTE